MKSEFEDIIKKLSEELVASQQELVSLRDVKEYPETAIVKGGQRTDEIYKESVENSNKADTIIIVYNSDSDDDESQKQVSKTISTSNVCREQIKLPEIKNKDVVHKAESRRLVRFQKDKVRKKKVYGDGDNEEEGEEFEYIDLDVYFKEKDSSRSLHGKQTADRSVTDEQNVNTSFATTSTASTSKAHLSQAHRQAAIGTYWNEVEKDAYHVKDIYRRLNAVQNKQAASGTSVQTALEGDASLVRNKILHGTLKYE